MRSAPATSDNTNRGVEFTVVCVFEHFPVLTNVLSVEISATNSSRTGSDDIKTAEGSR